MLVTLFWWQNFDIGDTIENRHQHLKVVSNICHQRTKNTEIVAYDLGITVPNQGFSENVVRSIKEEMLIFPTVDFYKPMIRA